MLPNFKFPTATDESDRKVLSDIESFGWHMVGIFEDEIGPAYCFSVGLHYTFGHPEILVMGLPHKVGHELINIAAEHIAKGRVYSPKERTDELMRDFSCSFVPIALEHYKDYLGYGVWFYRSLDRPFPALQLVWPDKQDRLPWEEGYDERFCKAQRLLDVV